ncbi:hypothetical protein SDRG_14102 [Saprolegnia diclina VS20]|uniref:Palmitoyltransferase n=1 Tax=Saprolegnia diclina (strain VS20) TaxID=1156394 RepID=T0Q3Z2_SAPDV|nr:hypothetical protein SDRG_14102 [Saprolegnia diclina VS20]EQC28145.1 hypothetical protein SDRG_14102 [Saprolegnia diclina VS20]|eukprot:XP_008618431.1 hypothetical protein SDRG_14102 [Saprolegnia diclina VS20]
MADNDDEARLLATAPYYESWHGNQDFYRRGAVVVSKTQWKNCVGTVLFITSVIGLYIYVVMVTSLPLAYIGITIPGYINALYWFARTAFMDPGFVPKRYEQQRDGPSTANDGEADRFCAFCEVPKPPRRSHCRVCNCCVDQFDHHCPWTGNCVGKRNHRVFLAFLLALVVLDLFMFGTLVAFTIQFAFLEGHGLRAFMDRFWLVPVALYATGSTLCLLGAFLAYHIQLISKNMTTNELIRARTAQALSTINATHGTDDDDDRRRRPSAYANWRAHWHRFLTAPTPPSKVLESQTTAAPSIVIV